MLSVGKLRAKLDRHLVAEQLSSCHVFLVLSRKSAARVQLIELKLIIRSMCAQDPFVFWLKERIFLILWRDWVGVLGSSEGRLTSYENIRVV